MLGLGLLLCVWSVIIVSLVVAHRLARRAAR